ncbi:MAG TPA: hypothetical protein DIU48_02365 [Acidobacteria bacterium]|nr:hypothetical protein [Acidobacteriota bacterium]
MLQSPWSRIGLRNLGRNPKRTILTALGLAVGFFTSVVMVGWTQGLMNEMVDNATGLVGGQIEIHDAEFLPERSLYDTIGGRDGIDVEQLIARVSEDERIVAAAPRVYAGGLLSSGDATLAGMLMGVDPEREVALSRFLDDLVTGRLPQPGRNELVVGTEMARQLESDIGDEVVVVAPGADGSMGNDLFTLVGTYRTGLVEIDSAFAVLPVQDLQALVVLDESRIHEVVVSTEDPWLAEELAAVVAATLEGETPGAAVIPWTELAPAIVEYTALVDVFYFVIIVIVFGLAIFGVANTMLMATYERRREFAVMLAVGTTPRGVVQSVLYEAAALGLFSLALGVAITWPVMVWWHNAPPDLTGLVGDIEMMGSVVSLTMRVEYDMGFTTVAAVALMLTALLSALYPAFRASRVPPADILSGL